MPNLPQNCSCVIKQCGAGVGRDGSCQGIPSTFLNWSVFSCISVAENRRMHTHYYLTNIYDMFRCVQYVHVHAYILTFIFLFLMLKLFMSDNIDYTNRHDTFRNVMAHFRK